MTMARAEIADDTVDAATAEETVEAATARVEAATAGVLAATADAEAMVPLPGSPVNPAGHAGETGETGAGDSRFWLCLMPHAPPAFAAEFRAMSENPRFGMALNDDCDVEDPNWDFLLEASDLMLRGVEAGWLGRAS
jgi:hypothetical protein